MCTCLQKFFFCARSWIVGILYSVIWYVCKNNFILSKWTGWFAAVQSVKSEVKEQSEESILSLADQTCLYTSSNFKDGSNPLSALLCSSPLSEGLLCYASELPESLLSFQVFKLAKAAFIVYFGISHLVRTSDVENNTNRQQIRWQQSKRSFFFSIVCLKESRHPSKKPKVVEPRISVHYHRNKFHLDKNIE